jgi:leader peptidase (prepilin peptidase)/N-methyltransferase
MDQTTAMRGLSWSLVSAVIGAIVLLLVAWLGALLFKKEAMGMGDVKFLAAICSFLGPTSITWVLPLSAFIGAGLGAGLIFWQRGAWGTRIPYGPFLGLAAILWLFGGASLTQAYWSHVGEMWHMSTAPMVTIPGATPNR